MSSDAPLEIDAAPTVGIERPRHEQVRHAIERQILCDRIEQLQRELDQERRQRRQIVDRYERLLAERNKTAKTRSESGLLDRLF